MSDITAFYFKFQDTFKKTFIFKDWYVRWRPSKIVLFAHIIATKDFIFHLFPTEPLGQS